MGLARRRLTPDFTYVDYVSGGGMNCVSCDICVCHFGLFVFFPEVFLSSRVTGACPVTTGLIMRVNVRTTTTRARRIQPKNNPVEKGGFRLAESGCVRNGLNNSLFFVRCKVLLPRNRIILIMLRVHINRT